MFDSGISYEGDLLDLGVATCQSEGFVCGSLSCNADCTFKTSGCADNKCSSAGSTRCLDSMTEQTCGDYDVDACLEWGANQNCPYWCFEGSCIPGP